MTEIFNNRNHAYCVTPVLVESAQEFLDRVKTIHQGSFFSSTIKKRTSSGCWTCRLRRKKCDETRPSCKVCTALDIECHFDRDAKPDWMDVGIRQGQMLEQVKFKIKEKSRCRSKKHTTRVLITPRSHLSKENRNEFINQESRTDTAKSSAGTLHQIVNSQSWWCPHDCTALERSDTILSNFFLETLLPFQFPFYHPSPLNGGRAWVLEMLINQPVVRQTIQCQSLCFLSAIRKTVTNCDTEWGEVLRQTAHTFQTLRLAIHNINYSSKEDHLHSTIRIMTGIVQLQRSELAMLRFANWQAHLRAMLALFEGILEKVTECDDASEKYNTIINRLSLNSPSTSLKEYNCLDYFEQIPSAEQAAFSFSSALVVFDDIIASTILRRTPKLYRCHNSLLETPSGTGRPPIDIQAVLGMENWVLVQISEIATLDAWKKENESAGSSKNLELMNRTATIKQSIVDSLTQLDNEPMDSARDNSNMTNIFNSPKFNGTLVTQIWGHAALIYLSGVFHGLRYASIESSYQVRSVLDLLERGISPVWLRAMTWPFCIAALAAGPIQRDRFRVLVRNLSPPGIYSTVHNALRMVENAWSLQDKDDSDLEFATCFELDGALTLLV